jgi:hypothetical protein
VERFLLNPEAAAVFSCAPGRNSTRLEFAMSEFLSPLRPRDNSVLLEDLQARLREMTIARQAESASSPAVKIQLRPSPRLLDEAEAAASVSRMQAEAERGVDVAAVHNGLDPQRVAKLLGLLD